MHSVYAWVLSAAAPKGPTAMDQLVQWGFLMGAMFLIVYFMMIRPQRKDTQRREHMVDNLKKNDEVVTTGGVIGRVIRRDGSEVILKVDDDVKIRFHKSAILGLLDKGGSGEDAKAEAKTEEAAGAKAGEKK